MSFRLAGCTPPEPSKPTTKVWIDGFCAAAIEIWSMVYLGSPLLQLGSPSVMSTMYWPRVASIMTGSMAARRMASPVLVMSAGMAALTMAMIEPEVSCAGSTSILVSMKQPASVKASEVYISMPNGTCVPNCVTVFTTAACKSSHLVGWTPSLPLGSSSIEPERSSTNMMLGHGVAPARPMARAMNSAAKARRRAYIMRPPAAFSTIPIASKLVNGEGDDVAQRRRAAGQHHQPVDPERDAG